MKPATSLCCLRCWVETRLCTKISPPTATTVATATIMRPVRTRMGNLLAEQALLLGSILWMMKEHDAKCRWHARTSCRQGYSLPAQPAGLLTARIAEEH